jgi:hypothetical protein
MNAMKSSDAHNAQKRSVTKKVSFVTSAAGDHDHRYATVPVAASDAFSWEGALRPISRPNARAAHSNCNRIFTQRR